MKSYNHIYETLFEHDNLVSAVKQSIQGRKPQRRKKIEKYIRDIEDTAEQLKIWLQDYHNDKHTPIEIYDGIRRKKRTIIVPTFKELAVQHAIINKLQPIFMKGSYAHSYAAMPGRGAHKGKKVIEKWLRKDLENFKYVFKMDIQKFFDSIPHAILKAKLSKLIHDKKLLKILYEIIDVTNMGIPLGFYTSQWFSNWYLQDFDHYVKEVLRVKYYVRFMDDIVIMSSSKSFLHYVKDEIEKYLTTELGLRIKENWQIFKFNYSVGNKEYGRDIDFMGFRFFRNRTILRRSIFLKALRKARRISKEEKPTIFEIRQMLSYLGWINCTNTYTVYLNYIKPFVDFQKLKRRISNYDKRKNIKEKEIANECSLHVA